MGACSLGVVEVAGSSPVTPTIIKWAFLSLFLSFKFSYCVQIVSKNIQFGIDLQVFIFDKSGVVLHQRLYRRVPDDAGDGGQFVSAAVEHGGDERVPSGIDLAVLDAAVSEQPCPFALSQYSDVADRCPVDVEEVKRVTSLLKSIYLC